MQAAEWWVWGVPAVGQGALLSLAVVLGPLLALVAGLQALQARAVIFRVRAAGLEASQDLPVAQGVWTEV